MDRSLFTSSFQSFPLICPRTPSRITPDSNNRAGFSIDHSPQHLKIACLALEFSDSFGCPNTSEYNPKQNRSLSVVASLLGFLHTLNAVEAINPVLSACKSKRKDYACHCSAEHGSSLSGAAVPSPLNEDLNTNGAVDDNVKNGDSMQRGPFVSTSILSDQRTSDGGARTEQVKLSENPISSLATSIEGPSISGKEPIYEVMPGAGSETWRHCCYKKCEPKVTSKDQRVKGPRHSKCGSILVGY